jgi:hypothetical protein
MRLPRLDIFSRCRTAALLTLPLLGLLHGCTMIVDADEYTTCWPGTETCKCIVPGNLCNEGLECFDPGICVVPPDR